MKKTSFFIIFMGLFLSISTFNTPLVAKSTDELVADLKSKDTPLANIITTDGYTDDQVKDAFTTLFGELVANPGALHTGGYYVKEPADMQVVKLTQRLHEFIRTKTDLANQTMPALYLSQLQRIRKTVTEKAGDEDVGYSMYCLLRFLALLEYPRELPPKVVNVLNKGNHYYSYDNCQYSYTSKKTFFTEVALHSALTEKPADESSAFAHWFHDNISSMSRLNGIDMALLDLTHKRGGTSGLNSLFKLFRAALPVESRESDPTFSSGMTGFVKKILKNNTLNKATTIELLKSLLKFDPSIAKDYSFINYLVRTMYLLFSEFDKEYLDPFIEANPDILSQPFATFGDNGDTKYPLLNALLLHASKLSDSSKDSISTIELIDRLVGEKHAPTNIKDVDGQTAYSRAVSLMKDEDSVFEQRSLYDLLKLFKDVNAQVTQEVFDTYCNVINSFDEIHDFTAKDYLLPQTVTTNATLCSLDIVEPIRKAFSDQWEAFTKARSEKVEGLKTLKETRKGKSLLEMLKESKSSDVVNLVDDLDLPETVEAAFKELFQNGLQSPSDDERTHTAALLKNLTACSHKDITGKKAYLKGLAQKLYPALYKERMRYLRLEGTQFDEAQAFLTLLDIEQWGEKESERFPFLEDALIERVAKKAYKKDDRHSKKSADAEPKQKVLDPNNTTFAAQALHLLAIGIEDQAVMKDTVTELTSKIKDKVPELVVPIARQAKKKLKSVMHESDPTLAAQVAEAEKNDPVFQARKKAEEEAERKQREADEQAQREKQRKSPQDIAQWQNDRLSQLNKIKTLETQLQTTEKTLSKDAINSAVQAIDTTYLELNKSNGLIAEAANHETIAGHTLVDPNQAQVTALETEIADLKKQRLAREVARADQERLDAEREANERAQQEAKRIAQEKAAKEAEQAKALENAAHEKAASEAHAFNTKLIAGGVAVVGATALITYIYNRIQRNKLINRAVVEIKEIQEKLGVNPDSTDLKYLIQKQAIITALGLQKHVVEIDKRLKAIENTIPVIPAIE